MSKEETPLSGLMSVVTPTHNAAQHLRRVVESVARQTVPVCEHIIINDGSTDQTSEILIQLADEYPNLRVVSQKRAGAAAARNAGIEIARGRYIAFLDVDDLWKPQKVEHQVRFMEEEKRLFSFGDYVEVHHFDLNHTKNYCFPRRVDHKNLLRGCPIGCLTAAYNQEVLGKRYMPLQKSGHDWGLWLELTREGIKAYKYPGTEALYSNGKPSLSSSKMRKVKNIYHIYRTSEKLPVLLALLRTLQHSLAALAKKARLIYHKPISG